MGNLFMGLVSGASISPPPAPSSSSFGYDLRGRGSDDRCIAAPCLPIVPLQIPMIFYAFVSGIALLLETAWRLAGAYGIHIPLPEVLQDEPAMAPKAM